MVGTDKHLTTSDLAARYLSPGKIGPLLATAPN